MARFVNVGDDLRVDSHPPLAAAPRHRRSTTPALFSAALFTSFLSSCPRPVPCPDDPLSKRRARLTLSARIAALISQLGLPGQSVGLTLTNAGGQFFNATIPVAAIFSNASHTRVRFRDPTGTLAGGITSLSMGGRTRTDVTLRASHLSLGGAAAGPFTATLHIGSLELTASGTLRTAGARLVFP